MIKVVRIRKLFQIKQVYQVTWFDLQKCHERYHNMRVDGGGGGRAGDQGSYKKRSLAGGIERDQWQEMGLNFGLPFFAFF